MVHDKFNSMLKQIILLIILTFPMFCLCQIKPKDSTMIADHLQDWMKAWQTKDPLLAAKWYSDSAEWTNAFGMRRIGKAAIEKFLTEVFSLTNVMEGKSTVKENSYISITNEVILLRTVVERKGQKIVSGEEMDVRNTIHHRIFKKFNGQWLIVAHLIADERDINAIKQ